MYLYTSSPNGNGTSHPHSRERAAASSCGCSRGLTTRVSSVCKCGGGLLGGLGRADREEILATLADVDGVTGVAPQVASNLKLLKWSIDHAGLHLLRLFRLELSRVLPAIRLIATSKGFGDYPAHTMNHLLRQAPAKLNGKTLTIDQVEAQFQKRVMLPLKRGTGLWCTVNPGSGTRVILGLGQPPDSARTGLHEAMHVLSNTSSGLARVTMLSEGGAEYFARQAARALGLSYSKAFYPDLEAIFGKLVTDFGDQLVADAFFGDALHVFEAAFETQYGAGRLQEFLDNLTPASLSRAIAILNLDYETMVQNRP